MKRFVALALLVMLALPAQAQDATYTDGQKWRLASAQLVASLESPIDDVKTQSLKNAIIYATLYRDKVDMGGTVNALRAVYEHDQRPIHRKLALAALQAIGSFRTTDYLARHVTNAESDEGRIVMASVLNDYYLSRTRTIETGSVSVGTSSLR